MVVDKSPLHSLAFYRVVEAVPVLHKLRVFVVTDPDDVGPQLRIAPEHHGLDVPLDFVRKAIICGEC
jgi:hypothetical protein